MHSAYILYPTSVISHRVIQKIFFKVSCIDSCVWVNEIESRFILRPRKLWLYSIFRHCTCNFLVTNANGFSFALFVMRVYVADVKKGIICSNLCTVNNGDVWSVMKFFVSLFLLIIFLCGIALWGLWKLFLWLRLCSFWWWVICHRS